MVFATRRSPRVIWMNQAGLDKIFLCFYHHFKLRHHPWLIFIQITKDVINNKTTIFRIGSALYNHSYPWNRLECHQCWQTDSCVLHHAGCEWHRSRGHHEQGRQWKYKWSLQQVDFHLFRWTGTFHYFHERYWTGMCWTSEFSSM